MPARDARTLVAGRARGPALVLAEPLSFWGGLDPTTGMLVDVHHPQVGATLTGRIIIMQAGRGSSSSSYVLAEAIRNATAPAAIVLGEPDPIIALGALVALELYGLAVPVVVAQPAVLDEIVDGEELEVDAAPVAATLRTADRTG